MATNNPTNISSQGTVYFNGTGTFAGVDGNTSGFVLTSNGTGVAPSFQASSAAASSILITTFNASGTWTKSTSPATKYVEVFGFNGGNAGGSGRKGASTAAGGGGGGTGGGGFFYEGPASYFNSTETVTVAAASNGGASQTTNNTDGINGSPGNASSFGNMQGVMSSGGAYGRGGTTTVSANADGIYINSLLSNVPIAGQPTGGPGSNVAGSTNSWIMGVVSYLTGAPAGGGGGADTVTERSGGAGMAMVKQSLASIIAGGAGGTESGTINGGSGNAAPTTGGIVMGGSGGGGGGGVHTGSVAGTGGIGGFPGGGGGGGGGGLNSVANSGAGGNGAAGQIIVVEYF